ncbi:MAG: DUF881 domain-containing protein [Chloroflexi bacterium]|nr:DUF881 domain-containing protein [Chloroflexota bacterium]
MRTRRGRLVVTAVAFLLGLLLVLQLRSQVTGAGVANLTAQDITTLIANLNLRNGQLQREVSQLEGQLRDLAAQESRGETSVGELESDLRRIRLWSGLEPVQGRGAIISFDGPIDADAVNDVLDELRNAGAEALAVDETRVVPGIVVVGEPTRLSVEGEAIPARFQVRAIGSPVNLTSILVRTGGLVSRIQTTQPDVVVEVAASDEPMVLPRTRRDLHPVIGQPRL